METALVPIAHLEQQKQAEDDDQLITLWLHGRSPHTRRSYVSDVKRFRAFVQKNLRNVTLEDLQKFSDSLAGLAESSKGRIISGIKSLFAFGHRLGYLPYDVGRAIKVSGHKNTLAERILPEAEVHQMLALEPIPRNRVLLRLLYAAGLRVSECCRLCWRDVQSREDAGQITVFGKGNKTRVILLSPATWRELETLRVNVHPDDPLFRSREKGHLDPSQVFRIVRKAARRAGVLANVSPHWLRHAHASHALDRGAPIHLVQATLGHESIATTGRYLHARPTESSARYLPV